MLTHDPLMNLANTDWHDIYIENTDLYICDEKTIADAHAEAPTDIARAYIYGIYESRKRNSVLAGTHF
ncbi:hypothetical protein ACO0LB_09195 [Undibacterium sp. SXout7W]|uniref:hypothetical protein n=1 Tax=Undibacterium sp. SXout7W TaxID=3413049 RepID=UPI003BEF68BC